MHQTVYPYLMYGSYSDLIRLTCSTKFSAGFTLRREVWSTPGYAKIKNWMPNWGLNPQIHGDFTAQSPNYQTIINFVFDILIMILTRLTGWVWTCIWCRTSCLIWADFYSVQVCRTCHPEWDNHTTVEWQWADNYRTVYKYTERREITTKLSTTHSNRRDNY